MAPDCSSWWLLGPTSDTALKESQILISSVPAALEEEMTARMVQGFTFVPVLKGSLLHSKKKNTKKKLLCQQNVFLEYEAELQSQMDWVYFRELKKLFILES